MGLTASQVIISCVVCALIAASFSSTILGATGGPGGLLSGFCLGTGLAVCACCILSLKTKSEAVDAAKKKKDLAKKKKKENKRGGTTPITLPANVTFTLIDNSSFVGKVVGESAWSSSDACASQCKANTGCTFFEQRKKENMCVLKSENRPDACNPLENPAALCMDTYDTNAAAYIPNIGNGVANMQKAKEANEKIKKATDCEGKCKAAKILDIVASIFSYISLPGVSFAIKGSVGTILSFMEIATMGTSVGLGVTDAREKAKLLAAAMQRWDTRIDNSIYAYSNADLLGELSARCNPPTGCGGQRGICPYHLAQQCSGVEKDGVKYDNAYKPQVDAKTATPGFKYSMTTDCGWDATGAVVLPLERDCGRWAQGYYDAWFAKPCERYNCTDDFKKRLKSIANMTAQGVYWELKKNPTKSSTLTAPKRVK